MDRLHKCSEIIRPGRRVLPRDERCFESLEENFFVETAFVLGRGMGGAVFALNPKTDRDPTVAVKLIPYSDEESRDRGDPDWIAFANTELAIACEVNALKDYSPCFVQTFGYLICANIPVEWRSALDDSYAGRFEDYILMFMEKPLYTFGRVEGNAYQLNLKNYGLSLFFILLHAIYVGRKYLQFAHGDIAPRNILFSTHNRANRYINLSTENKTFYIDFLPNTIPKLIDFGHAHTQENQRPQQSLRDTDVENLVETLGSRDDIRTQDWYRILVEEEFEDRKEEAIHEEYDDFKTEVSHKRYKETSDFLESFTLFKEFHREARHARVTEKCAMCCQQACSVMFKGSTTIGLCGDFCASKLRGIAHILP